MFAGVVLVAHLDGASPSRETVLSQVARHSVGGGVLYGYVQLATALVLLVAANSAFNGFPPLAVLHGPRQLRPALIFAHGDRLAFTYGIDVLAVVAAVLYAAFGGQTDPLIPLYAVGVFLAFTLSQSAMVVHWWRHRELAPRGRHQPTRRRAVGHRRGHRRRHQVHRRRLGRRRPHPAHRAGLPAHPPPLRARPRGTDPARRPRPTRAHVAPRPPVDPSRTRPAGRSDVRQPGRGSRLRRGPDRRTRPRGATSAHLRRLAGPARPGRARQPQRRRGAALSLLPAGMGRPPAPRGRRFSLPRDRRPTGQLHRGTAPPTPRHHAHRHRPPARRPARLAAHPAQPHRPAAAQDAHPPRGHRHHQRPFHLPA